MAMGMSYHDYWYGDVTMSRIYYEADKLRQQRMSEEAWLNGAYVFRALDATVGNMFRKKGTQPTEYPKQPINILNEEKIRKKTYGEQKQEAVFARAYMMQMMDVGKNWGKK